MADELPEGFPWRDGNALELYPDGETFFPAMLEAIGRARQFVFLEMYLCESGRVATRFIQVLAAARRRHVDVRLLLDAFGSLGLARADRRRLRDAGVAVCFYNPLRLRPPFRNLARDHRKLLLVDGEEAWTGGAGIADEFMSPEDPRRSWRETMVRVRGPVVQDWLALFQQIWLEQSDIPLRWVPVAMHSASNGFQARVVASRRLTRQEVKRSLLREAGHARRVLWIATAYFVPSWTVRRAVRRAAGRGVDVRLLLPGAEVDHPGVRYAGRRYYERLLRAGVRIFEFDERFLHMKVALADDWTSIGSCNLDHWTLRWNLEASQEARDAGFAERVRRMLLDDFARAREILPDEWQRRSRLNRLLEWLTGLADRILAMLSHR